MLSSLHYELLSDLAPRLKHYTRGYCFFYYMRGMRFKLFRKVETEKRSIIPCQQEFKTPLGGGGESLSITHLINFWPTYPLFRLIPVAKIDDFSTTYPMYVPFMSTSHLFSPQIPCIRRYFLYQNILYSLNPLIRPRISLL